MEDNNIFNFVDIDSSSALLQYRTSIQKLFQEAFGKAISDDLWDWAYQKNPFGSPIVSMAFFKDRLVGHYAVIPMDLSKENKTIKGYLSMTTMVSTDFRGKQLFTTLANRVYDRISEKNEPTIVFGFPNDQSAPGFIKKLGWNVSENFHVVALQQTDLYQAQNLLAASMEDSYKLNLESNNVAQWRCNKPQQTWSVQNGLAIKEHSDGYDLMYIDEPIKLSRLQLDKNLHAIMPISKEQAKDLNWTISFPYRFGYRMFNSDFEPKISVQMCMSDVF